MHRKQGLFLSFNVDEREMSGRKQDLNPMRKKLMKLDDLGEPTPFLDHVYLGCTQRECKSNDSIFGESSKRKNRKRWESCQRCALKSSRNARTWHALVDQTHSVVREQPARAVTKWTRTLKKRLARLISYIHNTSDYRQYCHVV